MTPRTTQVSPGDGWTPVPAEPGPVSLGGGIPAWLGQEDSFDDLDWPDASEAGSAGLSLADGGFPPADATGPASPGLERDGSVYGVAGAGFLTGADEPDRMARAALGYLADPGDPVLGALLRHCTAVQVVAALVAGQHPLAGRPSEAAALAGLDRALARWSVRVSRLPPPG